MAEQLPLAPLCQQFRSAESFAPPGGGNERVNSQGSLSSKRVLESGTLLKQGGGVKPNQTKRPSDAGHRRAASQHPVTYMFFRSDGLPLLP